MKGEVEKMGVINTLEAKKMPYNFYFSLMTLSEQVIRWDKKGEKCTRLVLLRVGFLFIVTFQTVLA